MNRLLLLTLLLLANVVAHGNDDLDRIFDRDTLIVEASEYACYRFDIYIASSDAQRARGLMFVREMPDTTGMLFVYPGDHIVSMWMKNTYIPLDMVFARSDGTVINVIRDTEPQSLKSLISAEPASFVLELNAGITARLHIDDRSRLIWVPSDGDIG